MKTLNEMKYEVNEIEEKMTLEEVVQFIIDNGEFETKLDSYLDECTEMVEIYGVSFYPSDILKSDPIAYRSALIDFADSMRDEIIATVEQIEELDTDEICDIEVTYLGEQTESEGK